MIKPRHCANCGKQWTNTAKVEAGIVEFEEAAAERWGEPGMGIDICDECGPKLSQADIDNIMNQHQQGKQ